MTTVLDELVLLPGWSEVPFRSVAKKVSESGFPDLESLSVFLDAGVVPRASREDNHNQLGESLDKYQRVQPNDLVFNKLRTWQGGFGISNYEGIVSPAYIIARPNLSLREPRFLGYLMKSKPYLAELTRLSKWMPPTQFDISWESIRDIKIRIPSLEDQKRISDFLDREIALINEAIALKQSLIKEYENFFQSRCFEIVTGVGLETNVETNLPWIKFAPDGWQKQPLRGLFSWNKGKDPARLDAVYCGEHPGEYPVFSGQTSNGGIFGLIDTFDFSTSHDCALISTVGALAGSMRVISGKFSLSQNCAILVPKNEDANTRYLNYLWPTIWSVLKSKIPSDMQPSVRLSDLSDTWVCLPPRDTQSKIVGTIQELELNKDALVSKTEDSINKLAEYKTSLITSAVTGNVHVANKEGVAL